MFVIGFVAGALLMVVASDLRKKFDGISKWNDNKE